MVPKKRYADVLLPLRLKGTLSYAVPSGLENGDIAVGSWVEVTVRGHSAVGIVENISESAPAGMDLTKVQDIGAIVARPVVSPDEIAFWHQLAEYYMCTPGEVFKAAYGTFVKSLAAKKRVSRKAPAPKEPDYSLLAELSAEQDFAISAIRSYFAQKRSTYLYGVTGSGKTEIYMHLAAEQLREGRSVLYIVPEIAISKQLEERLGKVFGSRLKIFHSGQSVPARCKVIEAVREEPCLALGTRSAVFLPFSSLGLVIVDEEHDRSFKQEEPAPRYNGRDAAIMLARSRDADVLLGSATPSFESLANITSGKYASVRLEHKYHEGETPKIKIIDTNLAWKHGEMVGSFSRELLNEMRSVLEAGEQVLVFRSRRAYSPLVQCTECGSVPKCPDCGVNLSYHRFNNRLSCHYCGYSAPFTTRCRECGEPSLVERGAGTEKIEEELQSLFPQYPVSRFDADTTASKVNQKKILEDFSNGRTSIMVGTQMITKGFDFEKLSLVVLLNADSIFAVQDFRSDERAVQLVTQLLGRAGRRGGRGRLVIQTAQPQHPVLKIVTGGGSSLLLKERCLFGFPPYVRLITLTVRDCYEGRLWNVCRRLREELDDMGLQSAVGPVAPPVEKIGRDYLSQFWIKLPRNATLSATKKALSERIELLESEFKGRTVIIADVDPM